MILLFSEDCPIFDPTHEMHLLHLLRGVAQRRHVVGAPSPDVLQRLLSESAWRIYGEFLKQSHKTAMNLHRTWASHRACDNCDPQQIADFYALPVLLIVENANTDGGWLRMVIQKIRPSLTKEFLGPSPAINLVQAGGITEIPKELNRLVPPYNSCRPNTSVPLRVVAMADSDAKVPGQPSADAQNVATTAKALGAAARILAKRTIENYVPDDALLSYVRTRADRAAVVSVIVKLRGAARDHYPMKNGLNQSEVDSSAPQYAANTPLGQGMGDFMEDLLENFHHAVSSEQLRARDGIGELEDLLDELELNI